MVNENLNTTIIILLKNNTVLNNPILFLFSLTKETLQSMKNLLRFFSDYRHNKSWCHQLVDKHQHANLFNRVSCSLYQSYYKHVDYLLFFDQYAIH